MCNDISWRFEYLYAALCGYTLSCNLQWASASLVLSVSQHPQRHFSQVIHHGQTASMQPKLEVAKTGEHAWGWGIERDGGQLAHVFLAVLLLFPQEGGKDTLCFVTQPGVLFHLYQRGREDEPCNNITRSKMQADVQKLIVSIHSMPCLCVSVCTFVYSCAHICECVCMCMCVWVCVCRCVCVTLCVCVDWINCREITMIEKVWNSESTDIL